MRAVRLTSIVLILAALLGGCRPSNEPPGAGSAGTPEQATVDPQQKALMDELLAFVKDTGSSVQALRDEMQQIKTRDEDPAGVQALSQDLKVAKALMAAARKGAADKTADPCRAALSRLTPALQALRADLPAARISQELERALQAVSSYQAEQAVNVAGRNLQRATDLSLKAPATLVPSVSRELEAIKTDVSKQDLTGAAKRITDLLPQLSGDGSVQAADRAIAAARGASEALYSEAWGVVEAQLDYLDSLLSGLQQKVEGALTTVAGETPAAPAGETEKPAEGTGATPAAGAAATAPAGTTGPAPAPPASPAGTAPPAPTGTR